MVEKLSFYDVKAKKKFTTDKYVIKTRSGRRFAVATSPLTKIQAWRILGMAITKRNTAVKKVITKATARKKR